MAIDKNQIKHWSECLPDIFRKEICELDDMKYEVWYDHEGKKMMANVTMYNGIHVCQVSADGVLCMNMPTGWATDHKGMMDLIADIQRLDEFISAVVENYK